jgi:HD superfamily phosphohydrolase
MKSSFEKDFIDQEPIMDSIYGVIKISQFEKRILSTKEMQRLRGIKQLGFVNLVYPDAEHSRFAHSIGVSHQAKLLVDQTSKNISNSEQYQKWRRKFINDFDDTSLICEITNVERIVISAAALLHDLPHSPFSHEIEVSTKDGKGIPVHDDFKNNPIFFNYLFDKEKSDLAKIISIYNTAFWSLIKSDLKWSKKLVGNPDIDNDGYIEVKESSSILKAMSSTQANLTLPVLGVMIFEILLFDKVANWIDIKTLLPTKEGLKVTINHDLDVIQWSPIWKWFRPYRKDIIANTICADLLDYLIRDGKNTGILSSLDLKFFDRTTIVKAIPDKTETLIQLSKIPDFCEHIVFDIFDHKRGVIRQSIITEIIAFLQQRYLLAERVYNHRVVEGARSMLQEVSRLLISSDAINVLNLHDTNSDKDSPITDDSFFSWVLKISDEESVEIAKAKKLVKMLRDRRIFREAVIIDGIVDLHKGSFRGNDVNCKTLADALLKDDIRNKIIDSLNQEVKEYFKGKNASLPDSKIEQIFTIGVRKYGKRYKIPRVLVARPLNIDQDDDIEVFPLFDGKKLPSINNRLESMEHAYNSLWKVFLFIHPFYHQKKYKELHNKISKAFIKSLYEETNILWENSIGNYGNLLPEEAIDIDTFVKEYSEKPISPVDEKAFMENVIKLINVSIPIESEIFKLRATDHIKAFTQKLRKIEKGKILFNNFKMQEKVIQGLKSFKPMISESVAARDKEELIINQAVQAIQNIINGELF